MRLSRIRSLSLGFSRLQRKLMVWYLRMRAGTVRRQQVSGVTSCCVDDIPRPRLAPRSGVAAGSGVAHPLACALWELGSGFQFLHRIAPHTRETYPLSNLVTFNRTKLQLTVAIPVSTPTSIVFHYFLRHPKEQPLNRPFDTLLHSNASLQAKEQGARLP